jgi:GAF domain-containing protein
MSDQDWDLIYAVHLKGRSVQLYAALLFTVCWRKPIFLAPFQGPVACTRIKKGRGVCGSSWAQSKTLIVPDVEKFPGHIACSSLSKSEIVLPAFDKNGNVVLVLDIDSEHQATFDETDKFYLEQLMRLIEKLK